jgi:DNA-binding PadR family transcriptional regulator
VALRFAILTALAERPSTGFGLAHRFDRSFGFFWSASHQQIYRELERLHGGGLVEEASQPGTPERGQPRRFAITEAGLTALRTWAGQIDEPSAHRESVMVRLRAAAVTGDVASVRNMIQHHLDIHESTYDAYRQIERRDFAEPDDQGDQLRHLVLMGGLAVERAWADWCREALAVLDRLAAAAGPERSATR